MTTTEIATLLERPSAEELRAALVYLAQDPLPCRQANYTLPGHSQSTLQEADDYIAARLASWGFTVEREPVQVQAFRRDLNKPLAHQYSTPDPADPWYTAHNVYGKMTGSTRPHELILIMAHKDSQSWLQAPGANDNGIGTVGLLELAHALSGYAPQRSIWFMFCNEEHTPWTSVHAAQVLSHSDMELTAALNLDGIGVKPPEQRGQLRNLTRYTTPEGEKLADLMAEMNERYAIGLDQGKFFRPTPGDDDGSFIKAGFKWVALNVGSEPYGDPAYHTEQDRVEYVDIENALLTVRLSLAFVLHVDRCGRPGQQQ